jgi:hypothetical protein
MNEYPIGPGYKFVGLLFAAAFFFGGFFLIYYAFHTPKRELMTLFLILGVLLIPISAWCYRETIRLRVTIDGDMLVLQQAFSTRSITLSDVDGYRIGEKNAFFLVMKNGEKPLQLPGGLARREELLTWIKEKYEDVDARERAAETEVLLEDSRWGGSREDREQHLKKASMIGKIGAWVGVIIFFWFFLYPQPYEVVMLLLFVAPLAAVYLTGSFKGLMRLYATKKSSPYPTLFVLMLCPILGVGLNAFIRYDLYDFSATAWLTLAGMTALLSFAALAALRDAVAAEAKKGVAVGYVIFMVAIYSYGLLIYTNCHYDRSRAEAWRVAVTDKHESHGKTTTYYLQLSPWGKYADGKEVTVSKAFYRAVNPQDSVGVLLNKGKWGIPWYRVVRYSD